jgi:phosphate transport system protein
MPENLVQSAHHHTVGSFDQQLNDVIAKILKMGELAGEMLNLSRKALDNPSDEVVQEARTTDKKINALDFELQQEATKIIALRQPMGVDLRFVISTLKVASSLERIGDLAKSTCKKSGKINQHVSPALRSDLKEMNALANRILNAVMVAFRDLDQEKAEAVLKQDDEIDTLYHNLLRNMQTHIKDHPEAIPAFADIIFAAKNFERIGDHCTKLADLAIYIATGQMAGKKKKAQSEPKN